MRGQLRKASGGTPVLRGGVLLLILGFATAAVAWAGADPAPIHNPANPPSPFDAAMSRFRSVILELQTLHVEEYTTDDLIDAALEGIRRRIDAHANVLTPEEYGSLKTAQGRSVGLGIDYAPDDPYPLIRSLYDASPADLAGLRPGDRILAVDGKDLATLDPDGVKATLKGHDGDRRTVLFVTPEGDVRTTEVHYERLPEEAFEAYRLFGGDVGYIRIRRFSMGLSQDLAGVVSVWQQDELPALIFDLRDCPGGFLDEAMLVADLFLPCGAFVAATTGRLEEENETYHSQRDPFLPQAAIAVLVDSLTASSAELLAGALQGNGRALVLGEETYGKREIQRVKRLPDGSALKVTTALFQTPADGDLPADGAELRRKLSGVRLKPDLVLEPAKLPPNWSRVAESGLLARFIRESSFPEGGLPYPSQWSGLRPSRPFVQTAADLLQGDGFDAWRDRLNDRLQTWGEQRADLRHLGRDAAGARVLRRAWVLDWAAERWGHDVARQLELHTDEWLLEAAKLVGRDRSDLLTAAHSPAP